MDTKIFPLISVIVPVYKVEPYLDRCVRSLLAQTYPNLEILLVDDGSPDACGRMCDDYAAEQENIRVIHKENGGLSSARNAGIEAARGEYLGFVDSDDWVEPDMYSKLFEVLQKFDTPMAFGGRFDYSSKTDSEAPGLCPPAEERITGVELCRRIFLWENVDSAAWDKLYRKDLFREIRYPVGVIGEDVPTTYKIALEAGSAAACPEPVYHYFHRPNSITTSPIAQRDFDYIDQCLAVDADVRSRCPELADAVGYLKTRAVGLTLQTLEIADAETRKRYAAEYSRMKQLLRGQMPFVRKSGLFSPAQKRDYTLMVLGLYRLPRAVYHLLKG